MPKFQEWRNRIVGYDVVPADQLLANPSNWRIHPRAQQEALTGVLDDVGWVQEIIVNKTTGHVVDGHMRVEVAISRHENVPVKYVELSEDEEKLILATIDPISAMAGVDAEQLDALLKSVNSDNAAVQAMLAQLAEDSGLLNGADTNSTNADIANLTLAARFIVPPFSVLDARQGYWQERKRAWLALGLQSELGRGENLAHTGTNSGSPTNSAYGVSPTEWFSNKHNAAPGGSLRDAMTIVDGHTVRGDGKGRTLGAIAPNQATLLSPDYKKRIQGKLPAAIGGQPLPLDRMKDSTRVSTSAEWVNEHGIQGNSGNQSGTSIFDPVLCELAYRWFSPPDGAVLDPFAGGSVRGIVAHKLGRSYTGIDLRAEQIAANEQQATVIVPDSPPRWITGDSCNIPTLLPDEQFDYIFSCPPYFDLEIYSETEGDLSNAGDYPTFLTSYRAIIAACIAKLKDNRFACFVVGDMRDKKGMYRNFVSDTIAAFQDAGAKLYNEAILVTSVGSLPIRVRKQFESGRKLGKTHQNVLCFVKGDPRKAVEACGEVEAYWPDDTEATDSPYGEELHVS